MNIMERANDLFGDLADLRAGLEQTGFLKILEPARGNQTAAQIDKGQLGDQESDLYQRQDGSGLQGGIQGVFKSNWFMPIIILVSVIGVALLIRRRK